MQYNTPLRNKIVGPLKINSDAGTVITIAVAITCLILLLAAPSLFTYTSDEPTILKKYSLGYTVGLVIYCLIVIALPSFLFLNRHRVKYIVKKSQEILTDLESYTRYISLCLFVFLTLFLLSRTYTWNYDSLLQVSLLMQGVWLAILPAFIRWGVNNWPLKYLSITQILEWLFDNINIWIGPVVVATALLLSARLGYKGSAREQKMVFMLLPAIAGFLFLWRYPLIGIIALVFTIAIPQNGPSGLNATPALVAFLFGLWIVEMIFIHRKVTFVSSVTTKPLIVLIVVACLSFGFGQLRWYTFAQLAPLGAQLGGLAIYILSAAAFVLVGHRIKDLYWLQLLVWTFIAVGAFYMVDTIISLGIAPRYYYAVVNGSLFWTWLITLAFSQAVFNNKLSSRWRAVLMGIVLLTFYIAYVEREDWKSGWVPPLVSMAAIMGIRYWQLSLLAAPFALTPISYLISKTIAGDSYSWGTRVDAWIIVIEITKASPIFGLGFANYNWFTPLFPIRGYAVRFNSHSQYVDIFAQTGILGFIAFIYLFIVIGWLAWELRNRVPEGFPRAYVYGALGGLVATLVAAALGDWVLPFFYNIGLSGFRASVWSWIFLGGLVVLEQLYKDPKAVP
ncbi:MAG: O-antigen ligase family protein [Anaerolineae bacterium]|nr:O-antigen ligase family protein [Anaerolineae bacterium]